MSDQPTQTKHPWRATVRTAVALTVALLPFLPGIAEDLGIATLPAVATFLTIASSVTLVLSRPGVNEVLRRFGVLSWLAAEPRKDVGPDS